MQLEIMQSPMLWMLLNMLKNVMVPVTQDIILLIYRFLIPKIKLGINKNISHSHLNLRFKELDVIANFQPFWSSPDDDMLHLNQPLLGSERLDLFTISLKFSIRYHWQYPIKTILKTGARLAFGR